MRYFNTIKARFLSLILLLLISGSFCMFYITKYSVSKMLESQLQIFESEYSTSLAKDIDERFRVVIDLMEYFISKNTLKAFLNYNHLERDFYPAIVKDELISLKNSTKAEKVSLISLNNKIYYDDLGLVKDINITTNQQFLNIITDNKKVIINKIIKDENQFIGLLSLEIDITKLEPFSKESNFIKNILLIDRDTNIIYSKDENIKKIQINRNLLNQEYSFVDIEQDYYSIKRVQSIDKFLVLTLSKDYVNKIFDESIDYIKIFEFLLLLSFMAILYYVIDRKIVKPLKHIAKVTKDFHFDSKIDNSYENVEEFVEIHNILKEKSLLLSETFNSIKDLKDLLTNVTDAAADVIFYKDRELRYLGCNREYAKLYDLDLKEIIGKTNFELFPPEIAKRYSEQDKKVLNGEFVDDYRWSKKFGENRYLYVKKTPITDSIGNIVGVLGVIRDITAQKSLEESLRDFNLKLEKEVKLKTDILEKSLKDVKLTKERLELLLKSKDNFISNISHKLRTPLNAIINFTYQIIRNSESGILDIDETKDMLNRVLKNSKELSESINKLLTISSIDSGDFKLELKSYSIDSLLKEAYQKSDIFWINKSVDFNLQLLNRDIFVNVDREKFLQILLSILSNSFKFTSSGFVAIRVLEDEEFIFVDILDTGIGIAKSEFKTIFKPFEQINSFYSGFGLGLSVAEKFANIMDIKIELFSELQQGSTFRLKIKKG